MPKFYSSIPPNLSDWALSQPLFFTASAPLSGRHVNISPKGLPRNTFTIFDANHAAYVDATGSGCETISHIYENGRITIMFCSFDIEPRILRLFCTGRVIEWDTPSFGATLNRMGKEGMVGARAVVLLDVWKVGAKDSLVIPRGLDTADTADTAIVQTSCGFGVPVISYKPSSTTTLPNPGNAPGSLFQDRKTLGHFAAIQCEKNEMASYQAEWNADSLDGLTGLRAAMRTRGQFLWWENLKAWSRRMGGQSGAVFFGFVLGLMIGMVAVSRIRAPV